MPINVACHGCGKAASVPDQFAGRRVRCKHCGASFGVPTFVPTAPTGVPFVVVQDRPARLRPKRQGRKSALASFVGAYAISASLVACIVFAASDSDYSGTAIVVKAAASLLVAAFFGTPVLLPASLSRQGMLSVGRWCILAGTWALVLLTASAVLFLMLASSGRPDDFAKVMMATGLTAAISGLSMIGCLVAAAVYPKEDRR